jgi:putative glutamine amidotransferase
MIRIALSYTGAGDRFEEYPAALDSVAAELGLEVELVWLASASGESAALDDSFDGLLLTGGVDVDPARYGRPDAAEYALDVDRRRDRIELAALDAAHRGRRAVLGICRGAQLLNVWAGGTLVPDLAGHRSADERDIEHPVELTADSLVGALAGTPRSIVNSSHHQAAERLAAPFRPTAAAPDGTIEAFERTQSLPGPYLLGVQWHPERMSRTAPLGGLLLASFLTAAHQLSP